MTRKLKKETFTWIRDIYIQNFIGADKKKARPVFCFVSSENYVLGYKLYSRRGHINPPRIPLPFEIIKNKVSYVDLSEPFILQKSTPHERVKKARKNDIRYIVQTINKSENFDKKFIESIDKINKLEEKMNKKEKNKSFSL